MREGIYRSCYLEMPVYVDGHLGAWLKCRDDWTAYFSDEVGCWPVDSDPSRFKEIIIDKNLFKW